MNARSGTTVVSLMHVLWRDYSWKQLELSPDFQSLPTQNIYREKLVEHPIIYFFILFPYYGIITIRPILFCVIIYTI